MPTNPLALAYHSLHNSGYLLQVHISKGPEEGPNQERDINLTLFLRCPSCGSHFVITDSVHIGGIIRYHKRTLFMFLTAKFSALAWTSPRCPMCQNQDYELSFFIDEVGAPQRARRRNEGYCKSELINALDELDRKHGIN